MKVQPETDRRNGAAGAVKGGRPLDRQAQVSESGQFTVSVDAVRQLPSFRRDVERVAEIREKLRNKR